MLVAAQNAKRFAHVVERGSAAALDHWMKHELHTLRKGTRVGTGSSSYVIHSTNYDSLITWLRLQPGVVDAEWDKCVNKLLLWPGHSTIGVHVRTVKGTIERCYDLQEGRQGTINVVDRWRPHVRKGRQELKYRGARACSGFVERQQRLCEDQGP